MPRDTLIQPRRGTAAQWVTANPILAEGELGYETDTGLEKRGDGATAWNSLGYSAAGTDAVTPRVLTWTGSAWPNRPNDSRPTFFVGGDSPGDAPTDVDLESGDVWIPESEAGGGGTAMWVANTVDAAEATIVASTGNQGQIAMPTDTVTPLRHNGTLWTRYTRTINALAIPGINPASAAGWVDLLATVVRANVTRHGGCDVYLPNDVEWVCGAVTDTIGDFTSGVVWPRPALVLRHGVSYQGDKTLLRWASTSRGSFIGTRQAARIPFPSWTVDTHSSPKAIITADIATGDTTFTVNSSAAFVVGSDVLLRLGQQNLDTNEPLSVQYGKVVAIADSTHIQLDIQADIAVDVSEMTTNTTPVASGAYEYLSSGGGGVDNHIAHAIFLVDEYPDGYASDFVLHSTNNSTQMSSQGFVSYYGRGAVVERIISDNGGPPAVYYSHDITVRDWQCVKADNGGTTALGRVLNYGSGSRNILFDKVSGRNFQGIGVFAESNSHGVIRNLVLENTHASRSNTTTSLIQTQGGASVKVEGLEVGGTGTVLAVYGTGSSVAAGSVEIGGKCIVRTNTAMVTLQPRAFRERVTLANGNQFDAPSVSQSYADTRVWRRRIRLTNGVGPVIKLPDGLLEGGRAYISTLTGVTSVQLDNGVLSYGLKSYLQADTTVVLPQTLTGLGANTAFWWGGRRFNRTMTITCSGVAADAYMILELRYKPPMDAENFSSPAAAIASASPDPDLDLTKRESMMFQTITARSTLTNSTTETVIATFTLPTTMVFPGVSLDMNLGGYNDYAATSGVLRYRLRLGGIGGTGILTIDIPSQTIASTLQQFWIKAAMTLRSVAGASTSWVLGGFANVFANGAAVSLSPLATLGNLDTTSDVSIVWTAQWVTLASASNISRTDTATCRFDGLPVQRA